MMKAQMCPAKISMCQRRKVSYVCLHFSALHLLMVSKDSDSLKDAQSTEETEGGNDQDEVAPAEKDAPERGWGPSPYQCDAPG